MERHLCLGSLRLCPHRTYHNTTLRLSSPNQSPLFHPPHDPHTRRLQRTNLKHSRASRDGVVRDGRVAAGQDDVRLAGDGRGAVRCGWDGEGETSVDGGCAEGMFC